MNVQNPERFRCCPECQSQNIKFDSVFGFYRCNDCEQVWAYSEDDPDLGELEDDESLN